MWLLINQDARSVAHHPLESTLLKQAIEKAAASYIGQAVRQLKFEYVPTDDGKMEVLISGPPELMEQINFGPSAEFPSKVEVNVTLTPNNLEENTAMPIPVPVGSVSLEAPCATPGCGNVASCHSVVTGTPPAPGWPALQWYGACQVPGCACQQFEREA